MATGTGAVTASAPTPAGAGYPGPFGPGAVTVPGSTVAAAGFNGSVGTAAITAASSSASSLTNQSGKTGFGNVIPPVVRVRGIGQQDVIVVPSVVVSVSGAIGFTGTGDADAGEASVSGAGLTGPIGSGDNLAPRIRVSAGSGVYGDIHAGKSTVASVGVNGRVGVGAVNGRRITVTSTLTSGATPGSQTGQITVRAPLADGTGSQSAIVTGVVSVAPRVQGAGVTGQVGSGVVAVPGTTVLAVHAQNNTGNVSITVPTAVVEAAGVAAVVSAVFDGLSVNTRVNAVTTYTGLTINSMTFFAGKYLAATDDGIVELTGATDSGTAITTSMRSGISDISSTRVKKIPLGYVVMDAGADIKMTMKADDKTERSYTLARKLAGVHGAKVKFGLGVVGRHWQWGFDSTGGAYAIREITFDVEDTKRRIT